MKTKEVLCKEVEHKHDRPWSTPHMQARKTVSKPITDSQGTMTLETFLKIKDQITKQDGGTAKSTYTLCVSVSFCLSVFVVLLVLTYIPV